MAQLPLPGHKFFLLQGDCINLLREVQDNSVDMILCDLPYGVTARNKWDEVIPFDKLWEQYLRIAKDNAAIVLFGQGMFTANLMTSNPKMWKYNLIWKKTQPTGFLNANKMPLRSHEDICVFYKKPPIYNPQKSTGHVRKISTSQHHKRSRLTSNYGAYEFHSYDSTERFPISVLEFAKDTQKTSIHPTQKPIDLLKYLILTYSNENDLVLDNCMGSGSTGVACIQTGRRFLGMELDKNYYKLAMERIRAASEEQRKI